jgi:sigma-B regulation protein RsbU (phosphoserine phosphatase)
VGSDAAETILIVDDNPTNLQLLFHTLNGIGHRILVADSGEAALKIAARARPQLILLDIMMPGMDGYEVCRRIHDDPVTQGSDVIFLSALDKTEDKVMGLELGAVDYITKPFQPAEVIARVDTHLTIQRLRRSLQGRNEELQEANRRMRADLAAAARVQGAMLPSSPPANEHMNAAWAWRPCDELAGDSLNVFAFDDRYLGVYVLDVSGHGVPAALLSVTVSRSLSPHADHFSLVTEAGEDGQSFRIVPPTEVANRLNKVYPMDPEARLFFTIIYGVLDSETGEFRYVAAGHPGPLVVRGDGRSETHEATGIPIGVLPEAPYEEGIIQLRPGDRLFAYTDGVYEERNDEQQEFGVERMAQALTESRENGLDEAIKALIGRLEVWRGDRLFRDDVTLLGLEMRQP